MAGDTQGANAPKFKSFADPQQIENDIKAQKEKKQREADEEKRQKEQEEAEAARAAKKDDPGERERRLEEEGVFCTELNKRILPEEFLERFSDLRQAIRDKRFLLTGYATITREIWDDVEIELKTPTQREYNVIQALSEGKPNTLTGAASFNMAEQARWLVVFLVRKWGSEEFPIPEAPTIFEANRFADDKEKRIKKFVEDEQVQAKLKFFDDLPMPVYERVAALCLDVSSVLMMALREDAKNP